MSEWDYLMDVLEKSVEKNGEQPLTNKWLLNCMRLAEKRAQREEDISDRQMFLDD